jgi:hypothetical protein
VTKGEREIWEETETSEQLQQHGNEMTIRKTVHLDGIPPGHYNIHLQVRDEAAGRFISRVADFSVE